MIIDHISNLSSYEALSPKIKQLSEFLAQQDLNTLPCGTYKIDEDRVFGSVVERVLPSEGNPTWEAHRKYLDFHMVLAGSEKVRYQIIQNISQTSTYHEEDDSMLFHDLQGMEVDLGPGMFCLVFPQDVHCPNNPASADGYSKKMIFKIEI